MAATIKTRRGTKAEIAGITLALAELGYCTDTKELFIGDGVSNTLIGSVLLDEDDLVSDSDVYGATQQSIKYYVDYKYIFDVPDFSSYDTDFTPDAHQNYSFGWFRTDDTVDSPNTYDGCLTMSARGDGASVWMIYSSADSDDDNPFLYFRRGRGATWSDSEKIWTDGNHGTGSLLDADLLDGEEGSYYATAASVTGLEQVIEQEGYPGWRLIGKDAANYGVAGNYSVDVSHSTSASSTRGATGYMAFASGYNTTAEGDYSAAFGNATESQGHMSHAEGQLTDANGASSHAEGSSTVATGTSSHAEGYATTAQNNYSHAAGKYNVGTDANTIHETGIGTGSGDKKNAFEIFLDGTLNAPQSTIALIDARGDNALTTKEYVEGTAIREASITSNGFEDAPETGVAQTSGWRFPYGWLTENAETPPRLYYTENTRTGGIGKYAFGANDPSQGYIGAAVGSWEITKWYSLDNYGHQLTISVWLSGLIDTTGYTASPPTTGETWLGEDDGYIAVQFYDEFEVLIDASTEMTYSDSAADHDHAINGDRDAGSAWIFVDHAVTVPVNTKYIKVSLVASDANDTVVSRGYRGTNAATEFDDYQIDYVAGIHEITAFKTYRDNTYMASGLKYIYENSQYGYRLAEEYTSRHGNIGTKAVDICASTITSSTIGATGNYSFAAGVDTIASASYAIAMGNAADASGQSSVAIGQGTEASGHYSFSTNNYTDAIGDYSFACGNYTIALNEFSFACGTWNVGTSTATVLEVGIGTGSGNEANAFEIYNDGTATLPESTKALIDSRGSKALVTQDYVTGLEKIDEGNGGGWRLIGRTAANYGPIGVSATDLSISTSLSDTAGAFGAYALCSGFNTTASGVFSTASGLNSEATGDKSFACGESYAAGEWSFSAGRDCIATGDYSVVMGSNHEATLNYGFCVGSYNTNTALHAVTIGNNNEASDDYAIAIGRNNIASADYCVAIGMESDATAYGGVALGYGAKASGIYATAFGSCEANGGYSFACGASTFAKGTYSFVCGVYNTGTSSTTAMEVGIGTGVGDKKNGLEVYMSGSVLANELTDAILDSGSDLHLVTKGWTKYNLGKVEAPYNNANVLTDTGIPIGYSHTYNDTTGTLNIAWATTYTVNSTPSRIRGYQIIVEDSGSNYYFRNQASDGTAWGSLDRLWTSADGSFLRNDEDDVTVGSITINRNGGTANLVVGNQSTSGVNSYISVEGARTGSPTEEIAAIRFRNKTTVDYELARIIAGDPDGDHDNKMGSLIFQTGNADVLTKAMTIEKDQIVTFEKDIYAKKGIYLGDSHDAGMVYNPTEDSLDFFF